LYRLPKIIFTEMKIALLISGGGTTAAAIIAACRDGKLENVEPVCVIGSSKTAGGIAKARNLAVSERDILVIDPRKFTLSEQFGEAILAACRERGVEFIGQYGWLPKTPLNVIEAYEGMIVNQHPAPLDPGHPDFGGTGMWGSRAVCARMLFVRRIGRDFWTEATSHRVEQEFDTGAIVRAIRVPILPEDTVETLYARLLPIEHKAQIQTVRDFASGQVQEWRRPDRLVLPGEEAILNEVKVEARKLYPNG
jgi:phosphoribosylglycinamide formyltransferase-1